MVNLLVHVGSYFNFGPVVQEEISCKEKVYGRTKIYYNSSP